MPISVLLALFGSCFVIALTPGAGAINSMATSLKVGWARTFWTVFGQELALALQLLITALGLGVLIAANPGVLLAIRIVGAVYLLYLGIRLILERPHLPDDDDAPPPVATARSMVWRGFIVNMTNPKAILFLLAFVPQFVNPEGDLVLQYGIIMGTLIVVDIIVMWGFFGGAAKAMNRLTHSIEGIRRLNLLFGTLFLAMAGLVAFMPVGH